VFAGKIKDVRVQSGGVVSVSLELDEHYRTVKKEVEAAVRALPWVQSVRVSMDTPPRPTARGTAAAATASLQQGGGAPAAPTVRPGGLAHVGRVLAVSSCKGGVGKSTVAVNLAYSLAQLNLRVGIFDADVYGPSLPTMVSPRSTVLRETPAKLVTPPVYEGVKLMSYGFVLRNQAAAKGADADEQGAVMRGPMVSNLVRCVKLRLRGALLLLLLLFLGGSRAPLLARCADSS
jgi:Mrp family chromosome partitioning ATPase